MNPSGRISHCRTLQELLARRASETPDTRLYTFLDDAGDEEATLTYAGLELRARRIAAALQQVAAPGERVMLLYPPGLEYVAGFFGCLYAGLVAVPAYPPDPSRLGRTLPRLQAIIGDAQAKVVLTTSFIASMGEFLFEQAPDLRALHWLATDELTPGTESAWHRPEVEPDSLAFLQYTSGSTGTPKGVMLSHANLLDNLGLISHAFQAREDSVGVIWLPPYHDMGLIGGILEPLYKGMHTALLSPLSFLKKPLRWLEAISRFGGTISGGPNFAFDLCVRRITPEKRATLDLSRWEVAFCGAEPIRVDTLERFVEAFGPCGFRREAFYPCYGLAEATLIASGGPRGRAPLHRALDAAALEQHRAESARPGMPSHPMVSCGQALPGHALRVVEPGSRAICRDGTVGEIWLAGPSVARGYWQRPEESALTFQAHTADGQGPWLRTGDLGVFQDGELFITGRLKDLIIIRGRNHYPQDIELTVEKSHPALRPGCVAAFSIEDSGEERLVVVQEVDARKLSEPLDSLVATVRQRVAEVHEVQLHALVLLEPGSIPKTSSGKIQRRACRTGFLEGSLQEVHAWSIPEGATDGAPGADVAPSLPEDLSTREGLETWLLDWLSARLRVARKELDATEPLTRFGLDSLASVELSHQLETRLGTTVPMRLLLQGPSVTELVEQLISLRPESHEDRPSRHPRRDDSPLSFAQRRLWFLDQLEPGSPLYNIPAAVRLEGSLDVSVLERCFEELVRRHESLRTLFVDVEGTPVQRILPSLSLELPIESLEELPEAEHEARVRRLAREEAQRPFELARGPLLRVRLLKESASRHVLLLTMHHIVSDGWSMGLLIREVAALYRAFLSGQSSPLPELPLQYADYAAWQQSWLQGERLRSQLAYWRQQLAHAPPLLELPTDKPRPPVRSYRGASLPVHLPETLSRAITALGQREGATPFMVLLAAFQAVLSRYSGQRDISVGSPIAGRPHADTEGLIGFFVNTLVLRTRLEGDPSFRELLGRVRQVALEAYTHPDVPFEKLVEELNPQRALSHAPLFQVMLALRQDALSELSLPGLSSVRELEVDTGTAKFDLTLSLAETRQGFTGWLEYDTELFEARTATQMVEHLCVLLEAATARPELRLSTLPLLTPAERQRLLVTWNDTRADFPRDASLPALIEAQVERTPQALAVVSEEGQLTYRELDSRANQLARHLRRLGVGPEVRVGVCAERSLEMVVALLGVLKAGGAYVPLDPSLPRERLAFMLEDSAVPVLLLQERLRAVLPEPSPACVRVALDTGWPDIARESEAPLEAVDANTLAYAIYTSGSTGQPKLALNGHRAIVNRLSWMQDAHRLTAGDRVLQKTPYSFDVSVWEFFYPLIAGARLIMARPGGHKDPAYLRRVIQEHGVTTLHFVPSMLQVFLEEPGLEDCTSLRRIFCSGEALPRAAQEQVFARLPVELHNLYGPTEAAVEVSAWACVRGDTRTQVPIGRPIANVRLHVLDERMEPVPVGVHGELYIGGVAVGRGYHARPALTAERFVPDPFSSEPGARLYRTGDRVRHLPDGAIDFLGRMDFQVKLRGNRIELGEIEAVLGAHPAVGEAVVVVREDVPGDKRLVAYLVAKSGQHVDMAELRSFASEKLPEYMLPSALVPMKSLPLTSSGKTDRKALPAPDMDRPSEHAYEAPRTPGEQLLASLWSQVLGIERVGRGDHFFERGGHSLLATQLSSRVRSAFGVELPLRTLFEAPVLSALAARIEAVSREGQGNRTLPPLQPVARTGELPLSFAQQRLWFLEQLDPGRSTYNMAATVRLEGSLDVPALERGFQELVRRHESLRTTFRGSNSEAVQVIHAESSLVLTVVDLGAQPEAEREAQVRKLAHEEAQCPFDLTRGPLLRLTLLRLADTRHVLLLTMHHIVSDGWSMGVLIREVMAVYESFVAGRPSSLPELRVQYADYAAWQRGWLQGETLEAQLAYWRQQLAQAPLLLDLPTDRPRPPVQSFRGATLTKVLPNSLSRALESLCQREGVTPFMALLAGFQTLLARYSGQTDIVVGTDIAGRNSAETEGLIGFFINQLVMRGDLSGDPTFRELLGRVRQMALGAYAHQDVPFEELVRALNPERSLAHAPLFQVKLVLQNAPTPELRLPGLTVHSAESGTGAAKFDFTLAIQETAEGLRCLWEYSTDLFDASTIERMSEHLRVLLEAATSNPEQRLSALPLMTEAERRQVLVEWNATHQPFPQDVCAHHLFEAQVERTPDAIAVEFGEQHLTYRQLDARANQLAWHLRSLGVGPEVRVGLCTERSLDMIVGLLGILKAGGAYVPLDPSYPSERLAFLLRDSLTPVLLTQSHLADELPVQSELLVLLDDEWDALISAQPEQAPGVAVHPDNLAYVIYTSGSTGTPKGTLLHHRGLCNTALSTVTAHGFHSRSRVLQFASCAFDASVCEVFSCLLAGGCLVLAPREELLPGPPLLSLLSSRNISAVTLTPSVLSQLEPLSLPSLHTLISAGEACSPELLSRWAPGRHFLNAYGPTEVTICASITGPLPPDSPLHLGHPLPNVELFVLDSNAQPLPFGVPGELFVSGPGLARGYLGRPELTADKFIPHPFSSLPGARLYRTGDKVRRLADGRLEFLGRLDSQVKLRGIRIELGEIDSALLSHPSVLQSVTLLREDSPGHKRLVSYVVPSPDASLDSSSLHQHLKSRLPDFMVPSAFVSLPSLPLTSVGKLDTASLPAPDGERPSLARPFEAPRNDIEQRLASVWSELLGLERVGIHDDFFELGGDSIIAIQVIARARQKGLELNPKQLFQHQTIASLASVAGTVLNEGDQGPIQGSVPLTPIQRAFFEWDLPAPHHYNQSVLLELRAPVDASRLEQALSLLVKHHDALRLRFTRTDQGWEQSHADVEERIPVRRVDLSALPDAERRAALESAAAEEQRGLNLSEGPLLRAALMDMGSGRTGRLLLVVHHLVVDAVSWRILLEDLGTAYAQLSRGEDVRLPPKSTSFQAWARQLHAYARSPELEQHLGAWLPESRLPTPLPTDVSAGANTVASARELTVSLDAAETRALLQELPAAYRTQINDVLLTALAQSLSRWTGSPQVWVDLEGHGREDLFEGMDLSRTVGWFTSVYPVRLELPETAGPVEQLRAIRHQLRRVPQRGIGYGLLRYLRSEQPEQLRALPRAEVSFNYLGQLDHSAPAGSDFALTLEPSGPVRDERGLRSHLLEVNGRVQEGCLRVSWTYSEHRHRAGSIQAVAESFLEALRTLIAERHSPEARRYTPYDFPLVKVDQSTLDRVLPAKGEVEDLYPLSPMQQGQLFQSLLDTTRSVYFVQTFWRFHAPLDVPAFREAWKKVVERHSILRTAFVWEGVEEPLQLVHARVELPWQEHDWRGLAEAEQRTRFEHFLAQDRAQGFHLSSAPLMRLAVIRLEDDVYQVLCSNHHLLLDGWSLGTLFKELLPIYDALTRGQTPRLERPARFRDYIAWLQRQDLTQAESFWRRTLAGFTAPTTLPGDTAPGLPEREWKELGARELRLTPDATEALQSFARKHQLTVNTLVQAAWAVVLSQYSEEQDVLFGVTVSGRPAELPGIESMLGLFINSLPMRVRLSPDEPLLPWLQRLQARLVEMRQYEYSPLVRVQGWSEVPRGTPLFSSLVVFENYPIDVSVRQQAQHMDVRDLRALEQFTFPLGLVVVPGQELRLKLFAKAPRFEAAGIERLLLQLRTVLEQMAARPEQPVGALTLLSEADRHQVLVEWNATQADFPRETCVHSLVSAQALSAPDALAIRSATSTWTYGELERRANQLAWHLGTLGVKRGTLVGVCLPRSPELVVAEYAILKAGGAYVPLDPSAPTERLAFMLRGAGVPVLLTQAELAREWASLEARLFRMDADWSLAAAHPEHAPENVATGDDLAYVIYTSGSSGQPKGVEIRHRGLTNMVTWWYQRAHPITPEDRATQLAGVAFDATVLEIWPCLASGASLHLPPEEIRTMPSRLVEWLHAEKISVSFLPTPLAEAVLREPWPEDMALRDLHTGGERLTQRPRRGLRTRVVNHYGPTESTVVTSGEPVAAEGEEWGLPPIGRPISNTRVYLLDEHLRPVGVGVPGELHIGGEGLAVGYLRQPALTAERFVPDPFGGEPGARLYRTGDRARYRADGRLEYLGRSDFQVKVRGFRIELGEIEQALLRHSSVKQAVVVMREEAPGDKRLVAYVVPRSGLELDTNALRKHLRGTLPEYMVPATLMGLESLPLTPNGKVDRKALPVPDAALVARAHAFVAPRSPTEELLANVWKQVLNVEQVGIHDDFFELGGHSLFATQVMSRIRTAFGVELPLHHVFEAHTVAELALRVEQAVRGRKALAVPPLEPMPRDRAPRLSFAQQRLWFLDQLEPGNASFNIAPAVRLEGILDESALERALQELVRRQEVLRTTFLSDEEGPFQVIHPVPPRLLHREDLRAMGPRAREETARRLVKEEALRPFDLARGPLFRVTLLRLTEQEHLLLLTMHHIVADGWSTGPLIREVATLYRAFTMGQPSPLPELAIQYADFAAWQRNWLQGEALETQLAYWRQQLAGMPQSLELPTDHPRPAVQSSRGAHLRRVLPPELSQALESLGREEGTSLFMTLLAGFQGLLFRYSGETDIVVGTDIANRTRAETEGLIGFFVNQLVMRGDLSGDPTFRELLGRVRRTALDAYDSQDLPFEELVRALNPERSLAHAPLFQVKLILQNAPASSLELPDLTLSHVEGEDSGMSKLDMTLAFSSTPQGLACLWEYSTDLYEENTIARMFEHLRVLLEAATSNPEQRLSALPLMTAAEKRQVLVEWNATHQPFPQDVCAHHLFEAQVQRTPDAIAVEFGEQHLTYRQLDSRANQLAWHLLSLGVGPEVRVGLCTERSFDMLIGILGILKAGGAYVPLDPAYPSERLAFLLRDSLSPVLLTQSHLADELPVQSELLVLLDDDWDSLISSQPEHSPNVAVLPDNLAYVIYTSGSTGTPKGTLLHHRGLCNTALASIHTHQLSPSDRVLQFASFSFDTSVSDFFRTLLCGARLVLASRQDMLPGPSLHRLIQSHSVSSAILTPSVLSLLEPEQLPSLRTVISAGEACTPLLVERWQPGRRFLNEYGPTEATVCSTLDSEVSPQRLTIGRPLPNTQAYVLDSRLLPVPVGVPGELFLSGPGLARGYLGRPELTAQKFLPNPFSSLPGARLYRTGDKVRLLPDGRLEFLGRFDSQVKLRGFRIELGEVESALSQLPHVQHALALVREDSPGDKRLVAYLVLPPGLSLDSTEARALCKEKLPEHLVPSSFVFLPSLPLTPHGKVDLKALPPPGATEETGTYAAPRTPTEELLATQWSQLLGSVRVGLNDNFFELGGHSLLATQVISRVRATFGVDLPISELFESPTVAGVAQAIQARLGGSAHQVPALVPVPRTGELPLSFAQQRLWFLEQLEPGQPLYNLPLALKVEGTLDVAALERSFQEVVRRHESLRTTFRVTEGEAVQVIHPEVSLPLPVVDLRELPPGEHETETRRLIREEAGHSFDLLRGPLLRVKLLQLDEAQHVLLLTMHHIVSDGWSMGILVREMATLYLAFARGEPSSLPELSVQYADYAAWQRGWLKDEALEAQLAYWREQLAHAPPVLELPTDRPRPAMRTYRGTSHPVQLPEALSRAVITLSQQEGATPFMVLLAAFQTLLSCYSGQRDISVGSPIAGRTHASTEGLIGFFVNTLVLRTRLEGNPSFRELLARVRQVTLGAYAHQDIPFEKLVEALNPPRDMRHSPLFQVMFAFQNAPASELSPGQISLSPIESEVQMARFDLTLSLADSAEGFRGTIDYNVDLFDASTIARMFEHLRVLLEAATSNPEQRLSALPLMTEAERRQVLVEWNATHQPFPQDVCAHHLFEAQVQRTPDAIAVEFGADHLTYRQLDARANQLAWHLISLGVGPEVRVGLCTERSLDMIVGLLGILKAGGAYVPLDPAYPSERLAFMLKDAAAPLLLTQQALRGALPLQGQQVVLLDTEWQAISAQPEHAPGVAVHPDNLAYVIYTSGSTGTPKGTLLHHRGLCNTALSTVTAHGFHSRSRVLQFASCAFDASVCEVFSCLLAGGCLVLAPREELLPGPPLLSLLSSRNISAVTLTPSVLSQLEPLSLPSLHTLISAGEACSPELLSRWAPGRHFLNAYGPTEVTICASITGPLPPDSPLHLGHPLPNVELFVLDSNAQPLPIGVPGELFVSGPGLARGYLGRPELTADKFIPHPFSSLPGARLYRTGDKVRRLADGRLEFLGRLDSQVKLRGMRIELGEIDSALLSHTSVLQSVTLLREDSPGHKRLVSYVIPSPDASLDSSSLHQHLKSRLPDFMVPSAFVSLPSLPLTSVGKLDISALPLPDGQRPSLSRPFEAPRNDVEQTLASIWCDLLGLERVGIHDDFFELGGHSLLATQIIARVSKDFGVELPLRQLFQQPTVAHLAEQIVTAQTAQLDPDELEQLMAELEAEEQSKKAGTDE